MNRQTEVSGSSPSHGRRRERRNETVPVNPVLRILKGSGLGVLIGLAAGVLLLFLAAGVITAQSDPDTFLYPASLLIFGISSLLCGAAAMRISNASFFPTALSAAGLWILVTFLISLLFSEGAGSLPSVYSMALRIPQVLLVLLGAFLTKSRPRKQSSRRRHR